MAKFLKKLDWNGNILFERLHFNESAEPFDLVVREDQAVAVLVDGRMLDIFSGCACSPFQTKTTLFGNIIRTNNEIVDLIFMSKTAKQVIGWGTPKTFDIEYLNTGIYTQMGLAGKLEFRIKNPKQFYTELVGANTKATIEWVGERVRFRLLDIVAGAVARIVRINEIPFTRLIENNRIIAESLKGELAEMLSNDYGIELTAFVIENIHLPEKDLIARKMEQAGAEAKRKAELAEAEAKRKAEEKERKEEERRERAERIAEEERREDRAFARKMAEKDHNSQDLATYVLLMRNMGIGGTIAGIPIPDIQSEEALKILRAAQNAPEKKVCYFCGKEIAKGASFCPWCGRNIANSPSSSVSTEASQLSKVANMLENQVVMDAIRKQLAADPTLASRCIEELNRDSALQALINALRK